MCVTIEDNCETCQNNEDAVGEANMSFHHCKIGRNWQICLKEAKESSGEIYGEKD